MGNYEEVLEINNMKNKKVMNEFQEWLKDKDFYNDLNECKFKKNQYYIIYNQEKENADVVYGIAISKKVGNVVIRNRLKRQIQAIINNHQGLFKDNYNYFIMIRESCINVSYKTLESSLIELLEEHGI